MAKASRTASGGGKARKEAGRSATRGGAGGLAELVADAVDRGATTVEEIHRQIADLPLSVLEELGLFEGTVAEVRRIQDTSIGAVYDVIRRVNREVSKLAGDLLAPHGEGSGTRSEGAEAHG